jgi:hypothetical protein
VTCNEEETASKNPWTDLYLLAAGGNYLRIVLESKYLPTPGVDAPSACLGQFAVPVQGLDVLKATFLTIS